MDAGNHASGTVGVDERSPGERLSRPSGVYDVVRWTMLAVWIFVMLVAVSVGSRTSQLSELETELDAGGITSVKITPGMPPGAEGATTQSVHWRSGWLNHRAEVLMITPGDNSSAGTSGEDVAVRVGYDIAERIAEQHPDVLITRIPDISSFGLVYGFEVPTWLLGFALVGAAGTLMVLVSGPQPWRVTRWGWFWILTTGIGPLLFLVLAGPTPPLRPPRGRHRRLTGAWAFLLALLLQSLLQR